MVKSTTKDFYDLGKLTSDLTIKYYDFTERQKKRIVDSIVYASKKLGLEDNCSIIDFRTGYIDGMFNAGVENNLEKLKHEVILQSTTQALKELYKKVDKKEQNTINRLFSYLDYDTQKFD